MIEVINGYPCVNPTDAASARRGLNPENPGGDPARQDQIDSRAGRAVMPAVVFDGVLAPYQREAQPAAEAQAKPSRNGAIAAPAWRLFDITV